MNQRWWSYKRFRWLAIGACLSFLGPLGEWAFLYLLQDGSGEFLTLTYLYTEIWTLLCFSVFGYLLGRKTEQTEKLAFHDALTGVYSRGYLMQQFRELLAIQGRYQQGFTVMMLDLDHFKNVNDTHGHPVGDQTLKAVASCIRSSCREADVIGRYGGEEFLVLCPNLGKTKGLQLAERVRQGISSLPARALGHTGPQTVSIGVAAVANDNQLELEAILRAVDQSLYQAKANGRNRVSVAPMPGD